MATPGWMYHPQAGKQLYPDLTPPFQRQLEAEGWRDSPEKLGKPLGQPAERHVPPVTPAPLMPNIRDIGISELMGTAPSHPILASNEALARMARIVDRDGDSVDAELSDEELYTTVQSMSIDEVEAIAEQLGADISDWTEHGSAIAGRAQLLEFLRPDAFAMKPGDAYAGADIPYAPESDVGQEPFDASGAPTEVVQDTAQPAKAAAKLTGDVALEAFMETDDDERARWIEQDATKADIQRLLDARGVAYKARDGKDALAHQLLASLTNEV